MKNLSLITFFFILLWNPASAQHTCGADEINQQMWEKHPALKRLHEQMESRIQAKMIEELEKKRRDPNYTPSVSRMVTTIPVVFHIMHNVGDAVGVGSNISLIRAQREVDSLNSCFRNVGSYASDPLNTNAGIPSADVMIEFCLASQDPLGFPTNGVTRHPFAFGNPLYSDDPGIDFGATLDRDMKHLDSWPTDQYFNIWIVDEICDVSGGGGTCGTAGYAFFPSAHGQYFDGAVVEDQFIGTSGSNTKILAHEIGHYLGLFHTFQGGCPNGDCTADGDLICDTPPDANLSTLVSCNANQTINSCTTDAADASANNPFNSDVQDMYENYMDYGLQSCQNTFTPLQSVRMNAALSAERASLHTGNVSCSAPTVNDTRVAFSMASRIASENIQVNTGDCRGDHRDIYVRVQLSQNPGSDVTLNFTTGGTATEGIDFDLITPSFTFVAGAELYGHVQVRIYDDAAVEGNETVTLGYNIAGAALPAASQQTIDITISDNDATPTGPGNFVYFQDFEGGSLGVAGWSGSCFCGGVNSNSVNAWTVGNNGGMSGTSSMYVSSNPAAGTHAYDNAAGVTNTLAISPVIDASSFSTLTLSFDYKADGQAGQDQGLIFFRFGGAGSFSQLVGAGPFQGVSASTNFSMALPSSFDNQTFQLAFLWTNNLDGTGANPPFTIDNFGIATPATSVEEDVNFNIPAQDDEQYLGPNSTVYFYDQTSNDLMAKIENTSAFDFGCTTLSVDRSVATEGSNTAPFWTSTPSTYLASKTFLVDPTNSQAGASYTVTLYYTQTEINDYLTATGKSIGDVKVVRYNDRINSVTPPATGTEISNTEVVAFNGSLASPNFGTTGYGIEASFTDGFSSNGQSGFGIGDPTVPFPLELLSFTAKPIGPKVQLKWVTVDEINNDYFWVERSRDRSMWNNLVKVAGNGTTTSRSVYQHIDSNPYSGVNFYRLKQVDFDGSFDYSPIVEINFTPDQFMQVYPNPFEQSLSIDISSSFQGTAKFILFNSIGQEILTEIWDYDKVSRHQIELPDVPNGVYLYEVRNGTEVKQGKLIK